MKIHSKRFTLIALSAALLFASVGATAASADAVVSDNYAVAYYSGESSFSCYLDEENTLYVSGNNASGQFGDGTKGKTRYAPQKVMENVAAVADGKSGFVLALKKDGSLYGWGSNQYAQLGQGTAFNDDTETNCVLAPAEIVLPQGKAAAVAAGDAFSVVLTEDGSVYTFGRAGDGQTGIAGLELSRKTVVGTPAKIDQSYFGNEKIAAVDAAENTGFALTESGSLYIWGATDKGILGNGSVDENEIYETPVKLEFDEKIARVSAETMTVMILTESGRVFGWGDNSVGQLGAAAASGVSVGAPVETDKFYAPDGTETEIEVKDILCGGRTNFVLSKDGRVFAFGAAGQGQAGCNLQSEYYLNHPCVSASNVVLPLEIRFFQPVNIEEEAEKENSEYADKSPVDLSREIDVEVAELVNSISDRTFVKDADGNMWSWGVNLYAMVCSGDALNCTSPVRSTMFRKENYDKDFATKNYMLKPAIVMSCVAVFAVCWFTWSEIKIRRNRKLAAAEQKQLEEMQRKNKKD